MGLLSSTLCSIIEAVMSGEFSLKGKIVSESLVLVRGELWKALTYVTVFAESVLMPSTCYFTLLRLLFKSPNLPLQRGEESSAVCTDNLSVWENNRTVCPSSAYAEPTNKTCTHQCTHTRTHTNNKKTLQFKLFVCFAIKSIATTLFNKLI